MTMTSSDNTALVLVDIQNDFLPPSGTLAVPNGRAILPIVQQLLDFNWKLIVASQDYHPPHHISFASTHHQEPQFPPKRHAETGIELWPDHCVEGTPGCEIESGILSLLLKLKARAYFVKKGQDPHKEEYSAFDSSSGVLDQFLRSQQISKIVCIG
ncbi:hypothetical protein CROQUDRAFT_66593 [Cronartium quercuum f. sp. fusiforme G11]|uniref:nicotinamidase n=1 Tax=Cronartium quercuum f. sp. fusiforme G11 TaxID=708437 RepID=A0A9P6NG64_9BASI|nr:hypothetical protein CROQUDRAFT_66593 [Cronartium quercuum f. sp. fusiforme G11]